MGSMFPQVLLPERSELANNAMPRTNIRTKCQCWKYRQSSKFQQIALVRWSRFQSFAYGLRHLVAEVLSPHVCPPTLSSSHPRCRRFRRRHRQSVCWTTSVKVKGGQHCRRLCYGKVSNCWPKSHCIIQRILASTPCNRKIQSNWEWHSFGSWLTGSWLTGSWLAG